MNSKRIKLFLSGALLTLALLKPNLPVLAGVVMLFVVGIGAEFDMASPSAAKRLSAFKRIITLCAAGSLLIIAGMAIQCAPWQMSVNNPAQARHAMLYLAVYAFALVGAPSLIWIHLSQRERRQKRVRRAVCRRIAQPTLRCIASSGSECVQRVKVAV